MRSSTTALVWDIWLRHRVLVCALLAVTLLTCLLNIALPVNLQVGKDDDVFGASDAIQMANFFLLLATFLLFLSIVGYTEFNSRKGSIGFPDRLFTLPLTSFRLVALPVLLGVAVFEVLVITWRTFVFHDRFDLWGTLLVGVYIVVHQTILWTLPRLGFLRILILGIIGIVFILALGLPTFPQDTLPWWLQVHFLTVWLLGAGLGSFLASWASVARQRSGGGSRWAWAVSAGENLASLVPRRTKPFRSPAAAHFWFEWRRSGFLLPLLVGATLIVVIGPLSWLMRETDGGSVRILAATLALPIVMAVPVGKAFSKPDLWSNGMSIPSFIAVKPLSSEDLVRTKLKVAFASATTAWLMVGTFISLWFGLRGRLDEFALIRSTLWSLYGRTLWPQYALATLGLAAGLLLTWRFLVSSLWIGLSGSRKLFAATAIPYSFAPVFLVAFAVLTENRKVSIQQWLQTEFGGLLPVLVLIAALAVVAKFWIAAWVWRDAERAHVREYLFWWTSAALTLVVFALLFWSGLRFTVAADSHRLRSLLVFGALLAVPFVRLGLAAQSLSKNRHQP